METVAWEQRQKHHGRAFVTSQPNLAKIALISVPTVKRLSDFFVHLGILTVTKRKTSACRWDFNHYALKYSVTVAHDNDWKTADRSSHDDKVHDLVLHSKGGAKLRPAASAASPLTLRRNSSPHSGENGRAVEPDSGNVSIKTPTAAELEAAAKVEEERLAAEAAKRAEEAKRWQEERRRRDEQIEADRRAREQAERIRRQGDHRECMTELLALLDRPDFDPTDYSGGLQVAVEFYRPDVMRAALADLWEPLAGRWRQAEAVMVKEGVIPKPILNVY